MKIDLIVFDVNETLLDVSALASDFSRLMGPDLTLSEWFARLLHRSTVANHLARYQPFGELGREVLFWMAERGGIDIDPDQAERLVSRMARLPAHSDVVPGLEALAGAGKRLAVLTNGSAEVMAQQMSNAGIAGFFERSISVESVGRFKPSPEVYLHAAAVSGVDIDRMMMVAAHDWDVAGAQSVGAKGCFVSRQPWGIREVAPTIQVDDVGELVALLDGPESQLPPAR